MKRSTRGFFVFLMIFTLFPFKAIAAAPLDTVQTQIDEMLKVLRDPALKGESAKETKEKKIWGIIDNVFDYTELSKRTLGKNWKKLNAEQQKEFADLFSKLLGGIYLDRIMAYTDEKVVFDKEKMISEDKAEVQSKIVAKTGDIPIDYRMILKDGEWRVYDVIIEGVSLVKNYRSQFNEILMNKKPEDLLELLRKKTA